MHPYDKQTFIIGEHSLPARPIEWDREDVTGTGLDKDNKPIVPLKYETACGNCAQLIVISLDETIEVDNKFIIYCPNCKHGEKEFAEISENAPGKLDFYVGFEDLESILDMSIMSIISDINIKKTEEIKIENSVKDGILDITQARESLDLLDTNMMKLIDGDLKDIIVIA